MSKYDTPDTQIDGQITLEQILEPPERLIGVARAAADLWKQLTFAEQKTLVYALTYFEFSKPSKTEYIYLNKKVLAKILDIESDPDHLSVNLYKAIRPIKKHSSLVVNEKEFQFDGDVVANTLRYKDTIRIKFDTDALFLFTNLLNFEPGFITMWSTDIFGMRSNRSVIFYEELRQNTDTRKNVNETLFGVKTLKKMFNIPETGKGSYMREKGGFNRTEFERKVINPLCDDLKKTKMIQLLMQPDGKYYEKVKSGNRVDGYRFHWIYTSHPSVATATEVKQIQERVDKNPEVLKVAKDILSGEKKKKTTGNKFNNFKQRDYDYEELEKELLKVQGTIEE